MSSPKEVSGASELYVFADASKAANGAVAHLVWMITPPNGPHVSLLTATTVSYNHSETRANARNYCIETCAYHF